MERRGAATGKSTPISFRTTNCLNPKRSMIERQ